ncbi:MAG: phosphatidylserine/phosphatidylglycerophosphate/cardiolipin synthase family protein, partial [Bowdeniella nasicola]|nr:phosphatidylserine/phosphatidylglycerophosphate/cardiolipin synthase family protein [Bowdeniella nasicola]
MIGKTPTFAQRIRSAALTTIGITVATQVAVAAGITVWDAFRRRREHPTNFPRSAPKTVAVHHTDITTYTAGDDLYADMLREIRAAKRVILFESFIWKDDEVGRRFKRELTAAARRGVKVFVIYDQFANLVVPPAFKRFDPALYVLPFPLFRPGMITLNPRYFGRDHRKILVVDEEVGFVGGFNIGKLYAEQWRDTHVRLTGEGVWELTNAFVDFWNAYRGKNLPELPDRGARAWDSRIRAALNMPNRMIFPVRGLYLEAFDRAVDHIYITQGYFLPDDDLMRSIIAACARGVDVRVIVPRLSNHVVADWVGRGAYEELLRAGVRIFLYNKAMVHAKTAVIDGRWSTVGTTNIDRLSMIGNFEINLEIIDHNQAAV